MHSSVKLFRAYLALGEVFLSFLILVDVADIIPKSGGKSNLGSNSVK